MRTQSVFISVKALSVACAFNVTYAQNIDYSPENPGTEFQPFTNIHSPKDTSEQLQLPSLEKSAYPIITDAELLQNPDLLIRALDAAVMTRHIEAIALLLPLHQQLENPNNLLGLYAQATLYRFQDQFQDALKSYNTLLATDSSILTAQYDRAEMLYQHFYDDLAVEAFTELLQSNTLPEPIAFQSQTFLNELQARHQWKTRGVAGLFTDDNINNAPKKSIFRTDFGEFRLPTPEKGYGVNIRLSAWREKPIHSKTGLRQLLEFNALGKYVVNNKDYNDASISAAWGPVYRTNRLMTALLPTYQRRWYSNQYYSTSLGFEGRLNYLLTRQWQIDGQLSWMDIQHNERDFLDGYQFGYSAQLNYQWRDNHVIALGLNQQFSNAVDDSDTYVNLGGKTALLSHWSSGISTHFEMSANNIAYAGPDFFNITREDNKLTLSSSLWLHSVEIFNIHPRLNWSYHHTQSNHFAYEGSGYRVWLDFTKSLK